MINKMKKCRRKVRKDRRWLLAQAPTLIGDVNYYTRGQAAARLDISVSTLRRQAEYYWWNPTEHNGVNYYDVDCIELARDLRGINTKIPEHATRGEIKAILFRCFGLKKSMRELVIETHLEPEFIRSVHDEWKRNDLDADYESRRQEEEEKVLLRERNRLEKSQRESERNHVELMRVVTRRGRGE